MTGLNHGITGAAIALVVRQPLLAVPLSFASHFAQDLIPHFGLDNEWLFSKKFNTYLAADFLSSVLLMIILALLFPAQKWLIWACMIAAASPDLMWAYYHLYQGHLKKRKLKFDRFARLHAAVQNQRQKEGLIVEIAWFVLIAGFIVLRYFSLTYTPK